MEIQARALRKWRGALLGAVAGEAEADDDKHADDTGRDGEQLRRVALEAEASYDGGREVAKALSGLAVRKYCAA